MARRADKTQGARHDGARLVARYAELLGFFAANPDLDYGWRVDSPDMDAEDASALSAAYAAQLRRARLFAGDVQRLLWAMGERNVQRLNMAARMGADVRLDDHYGPRYVQAQRDTAALWSDMPFPSVLILDPEPSPLGWALRVQWEIGAGDWHVAGIALDATRRHGTVICRTPERARESARVMTYTFANGDWWDRAAVGMLLPTTLRAAVTRPTAHPTRQRGRGRAHARASIAVKRAHGVVPQFFYALSTRASEPAPARTPAPPTPPTTLAYRHDRAAHWRVLVRRGIGLTASRRAALERPRSGGEGYRVYEVGVPLPEDVEALLALRGHTPRQTDEWIAVLRVRVRHTVVGDDALPYRSARREALT